MERIPEFTSPPQVDIKIHSKKMTRQFIKSIWFSPTFMILLIKLQVSELKSQSMVKSWVSVGEWYS